MKRLFFLTLFSFLSTIVLAQQYKGSIEAGYDFMPNEDWGDNATGKLAVFTTHGVMLKPWLFVGAGVGFQMIPTKMIVTYKPVYADVRTTYTSKIAQPFAEMRFGYSFGDLDGIYAHPSVDCRFCITKKKAIYLAVGYEIKKVTFYGDTDKWKTKHGYLSFCIGFDF